MNWTKILQRLNFWFRLDKKHQKAMNNYVKELVINEYTPILEDDCINAYLDGLTLNLKDGKEIEDWLSYYLYEAKNMDEPIVTDEEDKKYNFRKDKEVILFLKRNYN